MGLLSDSRPLKHNESTQVFISESALYRTQLKDLGRRSDGRPLKHSDGLQARISESGLYSLILGSQKAEAKVFQRWLTNELLPSIRKTGQFTLNTGADVSKKRAELEIAEIDTRIQSCKRQCLEEQRRCIEDGIL